VVAPARMFLEARGPAAAYRRLPQAFRLDGGVTVWVYERMRQVTAAEVAELSDELRRRYPDRPWVWRPAGGSPG
jgi:hypothetical protein